MAGLLELLLLLLCGSSPTVDGEAGGRFDPEAGGRSSTVASAAAATAARERQVPSPSLSRLRRAEGMSAAGEHAGL